MEEQVISKAINGWDYQNSDRIFYKEGYYYDYVVGVKSIKQQEDGSLLLELELLSGELTMLTLHIYGDQIVHFEFKNQMGAFEMPSDVYLMQEKLQTVVVDIQESDTECNIYYQDLTIQLLKEPFQLVVKQGDQVKFLTSTKKVSRQFITPGLGQRVSPDGKREGFLSWSITNGEAFYGLGEKFGSIEKSQSRVTEYAMDACGTNTTDLSYKDYPILLSTKGYGLLFDTARRNHWDVGDFCYVSASYLVESAVLRGYLFLGEDVKRLISQCAEITGKPELPAPWTLGVWYSRCAYMNKEEVEDVHHRLKKLSIPFDVLHLDVHWGKNYWYDKYWVDCCDFEWGTEKFPEPQKYLAELWEQGTATSVWLNPYLPPGTAVYQEALEKGYLVRTIDGGTAHIKRRQVSDIGLPDLSNPAAYDWWKEQVKAILKLGIRVVKPDYTDRIPEDALFYNGYTGIDMHNMYIYLYIKACYEATQEVHGTSLVWKRPGFLGTGRFTGTWSGDVESTFEGLRMTLRGGLSVGFSGETLWSSDIAGFKGEKPSAELYIRWSQVGLLCSLARYHGTTVREPWFYGNKAVEVVKKYSELRYRWVPYLLELTQSASETGIPVMRHLAIEYPKDPIAQKIEDQFLLGDSILVIPVLEEGQTERTFYLPAGRWYDWHNQEWLTGNQVVTQKVTLDDIPLFVREGSVLPEFKRIPQHLKKFDHDEIQLVCYGTPQDKEGSLIDSERMIVNYKFIDGVLLSEKKDLIVSSI
ncbi:TIM-barrel domain-containing protein [Enterococcus sp. AZ196]|uniref:glycoside hydrolase family 31 protein n=1 Tax=Enterococcus sp. AZ196 TaxID=2774659 RepID=UPI003D26D332